jgi:hypothetical protein
MHEMATMHDAATAAAESPFLEVEGQWAVGTRAKGSPDCKICAPKHLAWQ